MAVAETTDSLTRDNDSRQSKVVNHQFKAELKDQDSTLVADKADSGDLPKGAELQGRLNTQVRKSPVPV